MKAEGGTVIHNTIMDVMMKKIKMISFLLIFFVSGPGKEGLNDNSLLQEYK